MNDLITRMRRDWDARAAEDAKYYVACQRRNQDDAEFDLGAPDIVARMRRDYPFLPAATADERRFLEIGCGLGRLMLSLAQDCAEIHGVDISGEMVAAARRRLACIPHAHCHVTENNDLAAFGDASFDFVYSYAVFQHIPDRALVYRYIDEAFRVLRPGGVFTGHFNGAPPVELRCDTWVGVWIAEDDLLAYAREKGWQALSSEGPNTQYLWLTMKKPASPLGLSGASLAATIDWVHGPDDGAELIAGGPRGFATMAVRGLPDDCCSVNDLSVQVGAARAPIRYIGAIQPGSWRQINFQLPESAPAGSADVSLSWRGRTVSNAAGVLVRRGAAMPLRLVSITDGIEILQEDLIECGVMQVNLEGCRDIRSLQAALAGQALEPAQTFCVDPLSRRYQANFRVPEGLSGRQVVSISVDGQDLPPHEIEVQRREAPR